MKGSFATAPQEADMAQQVFWQSAEYTDLSLLGD
jgi:hypothetical protein